MELTLDEMSRINTLIDGKIRTCRGKGKTKEIPEPPLVTQTPEPKRPEEHGAAATRNPEEPEVDAKGARSVKRPPFH